MLVDDENHIPTLRWLVLNWFFVISDKMSHLCEIIQQIIRSQRELGSGKNSAREILYNRLLYKCIIMTKGLITNHQSFSFGPVQTKMSSF